jgi:hypothetical protein
MIFVSSVIFDENLSRTRKISLTVLDTFWLFYYTNTRTDVLNKLLVLLYSSFTLGVFVLQFFQNLLIKLINSKSDKSTFNEKYSNTAL